ncbi:MAG: LysR family transcriptional regulator [Candidatus Protistobacter heckmanni]|nr:LysR family transcriptional regulator [Candidatus Protistobacter heckmanni]
MELRDIDLNLLVVFHRLLTQKRVSAVADSLGLTQPAVSNALARLRRLLDDELFLRTTRGMEPTPFALQLAEPVAEALATLHSAINARASFDPASSSRAFSIAISDIGEIYFLPALMEELARLAPGVTLRTVRHNAVDLREEMETGRIDLAVGLLPQLQTGFFQRQLFRQRYVCMFRKDHPLAKKRSLILKDFTAAEHVLVAAAGTGHGKVDEALERAGIVRRARLSVPHFVAVGHILAATDMIATVPERFAERTAAPFGLTWAAHPAPIPDGAIHMLWHAKYHRDPGNRWLRELIFQLFGDAGKTRRRT